MYIFTNDTGKRVLAMRNFETTNIETNPAGKQAVAYSRELVRKHKKPIIAWVQVGENNSQLKIYG